MDKQEKLQRAENKKKVAKKNFKYNRFLMLRYLLAVFFFANVYWALALILSGSISIFLPIVLLICIVPGIAEHIKLYGLKENQQPNLEWNSRYHMIQMFVNGGIILSLLSEWGIHTFFPFIETNWSARLIMMAVLSIGMIISLICTKRIQKINGNKDKHFGLIAEFESVVR